MGTYQESVRTSQSTFDRSIPGYGAFMGKIDVDKMDLVKCALEAGVIDMGPIASFLWLGIPAGWMSNGAMPTYIRVTAPRPTKHDATGETWSGRQEHGPGPSVDFVHKGIPCMACAP